MDIVSFAIGLAAGSFMSVVPDLVRAYFYRKHLEKLGEHVVEDYYSPPEDPDDIAEREKKEEDDNRGAW